MPYHACAQAQWLPWIKIGACRCRSTKKTFCLSEAASTFLQDMPDVPRCNCLALRFQACADAEIKTVPRHFARANQADRCINLLHCVQRSTPSLDTRGCNRRVECFSLFERYVTLRHFRSVHMAECTRSIFSQSVRPAAAYLAISLLRPSGEKKQTFSVVS